MYFQLKLKDPIFQLSRFFSHLLWLKWFLRTYLCWSSSSVMTVVEFHSEANKIPLRMFIWMQKCIEFFLSHLLDLLQLLSLYQVVTDRKKSGDIAPLIMAKMRILFMCKKQSHHKIHLSLYLYMKYDLTQEAL